MVIILGFLGLLIACNESYPERITYYESGALKEKTIFPDKSDTTNQIYYEYYENGLPKRYIELTNGLWNGNIKNFYPNGMVKEDFHFKNGISDGVFRVYDSDGDKIQEYLFVEGIKLVYSELLVNDSLGRYKYVFYDVLDNEANYSGQLVYEENGDLRPSTSDFWLSTNIDTLLLGEEYTVDVKSNVKCNNCSLKIELENNENLSFSNRIIESESGSLETSFKITPQKTGYGYLVGSLYVIEKSGQNTKSILHQREFKYYFDFTVNSEK